MERRSPVLVSPSPPAAALGTPITALPITPAFGRRSSLGRASASSDGRLSTDRAARAASAAGSACDGQPVATPSFANRGFVSRFSAGPQPAAAAGSEDREGSSTPLSGPRPSWQPREARGAGLWERHGRRLSAPSGYSETAGWFAVAAM